MGLSVPGAPVERRRLAKKTRPLGCVAHIGQPGTKFAEILGVVYYPWQKRRGGVHRVNSHGHSLLIFLATLWQLR